MDHPVHEPELSAIVGKAPKDYVWCGECVRWEHGDRRDHERPDNCAKAKVLFWISDLLMKIAVWWSRRATLAQALYLVRTGQGVSAGKGRCIVCLASAGEPCDAGLHS